MPSPPGPLSHKGRGGAKESDYARFGAVILAAGLSTRMRENKVLLPWRYGRPIVAHVVAKYAKAGIDPIIVVTGRDAAEVRAAVADLPASCVHNPDYASGEMLSSVKIGLGALPDTLAGAFIQPADMPCVPHAVISELAAAHEAGWNVAPRFEGQRGHPVLLDRANWGAMLALPADARPRDGLRGARLRMVDVADAGVLLDLDTRESYERALGRGS